MITILILLAIVYIFFIPIIIQGMYHNKWKHEHKNFLSFYKDTKRLATVIYYILTSFTLVWFIVIKLINTIADGITIMFNRI